MLHVKIPTKNQIKKPNAKRTHVKSQRESQLEFDWQGKHGCVCEKKPIYQANFARNVCAHLRGVKNGKRYGTM